MCKANTVYYMRAYGPGQRFLTDWQSRVDSGAWLSGNPTEIRNPPVLYALYCAVYTLGSGAYSRGAEGESYHSPLPPHTELPGQFQNFKENGGKEWEGGVQKIGWL